MISSARKAALDEAGVRSVRVGRRCRLVGDGGGTGLAVGSVHVSPEQEERVFVLTTSNTEKRILETILPHAEALGFEIVRVRWHSGRQPGIQVMAESAATGRMSVDDCARLSRAVEPALDVLSAMTGDCALEVSSPGIDRPLTRTGDFAAWRGHLARVLVHDSIADRRRFTGHILSETDGLARLRLSDGEEIDIALDQMRSAELVLTEELISGTQPSCPNDRGVEH